VRGYGDESGGAGEFASVSEASGGVWGGGLYESGVSGGVVGVGGDD